jgi:hypothetical protein
MVYVCLFTLWLFNIAMEHGPFIDGLPMKNGGSFHGYVSHGSTHSMMRRRLQAETYYGDVIPAEPATTSNSAWAGAKSSTASITSIANIQT